MSKIERVKALYSLNNELEFRITTAEYNIIKQLVRMQLAELIENDASDNKIDFFTSMDVNLTTQYNDMMSIINDEDDVDGDLPF